MKFKCSSDTNLEDWTAAEHKHFWWHRLSQWCVAEQVELQASLWGHPSFQRTATFVTLAKGCRGMTEHLTRWADVIAVEQLLSTKATKPENSPASTRMWSLRRRLRGKVTDKDTEASVFELFWARCRVRKGVHGCSTWVMALQESDSAALAAGAIKHNIWTFSLAWRGDILTLLLFLLNLGIHKACPYRSLL